MSQNQSNQSVQITITVSQKFHQVLEGMAKAFDKSVEEYILDQVIVGLDSDLERPAGPIFGFTEDLDYQPQLRALASGGAA